MTGHAQGQGENLYSDPDGSGNGHHGTIVGENIMPTTDRFGVPNGAYEFFLSGDFQADLDRYIQITGSPDFDCNPSVTYAAWVYVESYAEHNMTIVSKYVNGAEHKWLGINVDTAPRHANLFLYPVFHPDFSPEYRGPVTAEEIPEKEWVYVVATFDGSVGKIYYNGRFSGQCERSGDPWDSNGDLRIGPAWNGKIDDVRIYNRVLSAEEIEARARVI